MTHSNFHSSSMWRFLFRILLICTHINFYFWKKNFSKIEKVMTAFSISEKMFPRIESLMCVLKAHINRTLLFKGQLWKHKQKKIYMDSVSVQWSIVSRPIRIRTHVRILTSPITLITEQKPDMIYIYPSVVSTHYFILVCHNSQIILIKLEQSHSSKKK